MKNIKLNDSGVVVSVEGKEFTLFKGSTFEDSEKVDALLDSAEELKLSSHVVLPKKNQKNNLKV